MKNFKLGLKFLGLNGLIFFVYLFASIGLLSLQNPVFLWISNGVMFAIYAGLIFVTASKKGKLDYTTDELENRLLDRKQLPELAEEKRLFIPSNGFIAGMYSQIFVLVILWLPNLIVSYLDISGWAEWLRTVVFAYDLILRFWFVMYSQFFVTFPQLFPWLCVIYSGIFVLICGIGYRSGPMERRKEQIIIERNKQKKEDSSNKGVIDR